jgi:hypothetical protein
VNQIHHNPGAQVLIILRHASAQRRQASAQALQCSAACLAHSLPQAPQTIAQIAQSSRAKKLSRVIQIAARRQISAQSRSRRMQSAIILTSSSAKHAVAQRSQLAAQASQVPTHSLNRSWDIGTSVPPRTGGADCVPAPPEEGCRVHALACELPHMVRRRNDLDPSHLRNLPSHHVCTMPWLTVVFRLGGIRIFANHRGSLYVRWSRGGHLHRIFRLTDRV